MTEPEEPAAERSPAWRIRLLVACTAILLIGALTLPGKSSNIGYLVGFNLPIAAVLWVILRLTLLRQAPPPASPVAALFILASLIVAGEIAYLRLKLNESTAAKSLQSDYDKFAQRIRQRPQETTELQIDPVPEAKGDAGEFERIMKAYLSDLQQARNQYRDRLSAAGYYTLFDAARLRSDKTFSESRSILRKSKAAVSEVELVARQLEDRLRANLSDSRWSNVSRERVLRAYESGLEENAATQKRAFELERALVLECEKAIQVLEANPRSWSVSGSRLAFSSQSVLDQYNLHIKAIQSMSAEQRTIIDSQFDSFSRVLSTAGP